MEFYPWHAQAWADTARTFAGARPMHAALLYGANGTGVQAFGEALAATLLCENRQAEFATCGACASCALLRAGSHPDLLRIRPPWIARLEASKDDVADDDQDVAAGSGDDGESAKSARAGRAITVDHAREVGRFSALASHRGGRRVVLLYPAESLRTESANTLLKTLEEPTPGLIFILIATTPGALMPTIVSRCQKIALPRPDRPTAAAWLAEHAQIDPAEIEARLASSGDVPLDLLAREGTSYWETQAAVLDRLARPSQLDPTALARTLDTEIKRTDRARQQGEPAFVDLRTVIGWLQRWISDVISRKLAGTVGYHPTRIAALDAAPPVHLAEWFEYARFLDRAARDATHPVNSLLFLEDCFARYPGVAPAPS